MKTIRARMGLTLATLALLVAIVVPTSADDPCEDFSKQVRSFASALTAMVKGTVGRGRFEVKPIRREGRLIHWSISYGLAGRPLFRRTVPPLGEAELEISAHRFGGYSSLVFRYLLGAGGAISCEYAVFPRAGKFAVLQIAGSSSVRDLDGDGNHEIVVQEQEQWGWDCGLPRAALPYWPRVFRLDPASGKLTDVSKRFPRIYAAQLKEFRDIYQQQKEYLSPECRARFNDFLARLKRFAG